MVEKKHIWDAFRLFFFAIKGMRLAVIRTIFLLRLSLNGHSACFWMALTRTVVWTNRPHSTAVSGHIFCKVVGALAHFVRSLKAWWSRWACSCTGRQGSKNPAVHGVAAPSARCLTGCWLRTLALVTWIHCVDMYHLAGIVGLRESEQPGYFAHGGYHGTGEGSSLCVNVTLSVHTHTHNFSPAQTCTDPIRSPQVAIAWANSCHLAFPQADPRRCVRNCGDCTRAQSGNLTLSVS